MTTANRELIFKVIQNPEKPYKTVQLIAIEKIQEDLKKFYAKCARDQFFFAVRSRRDVASGKMNHRIFDVYNYKHYVGAGWLAYEKLVQERANELLGYLNGLLRFHMVAHIAPDTTKVYGTHAERPIVFHIRVLVDGQE